jgi:hypothetical protein
VAPSTPSRSTSLFGRKSWDRHVFAQMTDPFSSQLRSIKSKYPDLALAPWVRTYCAAYEGMTKLIHSSDGAHELYDLGSDPGELRNRTAADPDRAAALLAALRSFEHGLPQYDSGARGAEDEPPMRTNEEQEMLEALGYVTAGEAVQTDPLKPHCTPPP